MYRVCTIMFASGERFPFLRDMSTGLPEADVCLFTLCELRAQNRAANTLEQAVRALLVLYLFLGSRGIDLRTRVLFEANLLAPYEVEALYRTCRTQLTHIRSGAVDPGPERARTPYLSSLSNLPTWVKSTTSDIRLLYIRDYLSWYTERQLGRLTPETKPYRRLMDAKTQMWKTLTARIGEPASKDSNDEDARQGLSPSQKAELDRVIVPGNPSNPWRGRHAQERNRLMVLWLLRLGLRRGELLGLRIDDIAFEVGEVNIVRRADDPEDLRVSQPNAKTRSRVLALGEELLTLTRSYVLEYRRRTRGARRHHFLFVSTGKGAPLSLNSLNAVFTSLRSRCPNLPASLTPHVLRYTFNDVLSEYAEGRGIDEENEKRSRSYLNGWSSKSGMAARYTRRYVRQKANRAVLDLQKSQAKGICPRSDD